MFEQHREGKDNRETVFSGCDGKKELVEEGWRPV
jgi:hypothetical protein